MKRRLVIGIMAAVLLLTSVMGVSAAESRTDDATTNGTSSEGIYKVLGRDEEFAAMKTEDASTYALIDGYNKGTKTESELLANASTEVKNAVSGKTMITEIFDLDYIGNETKTSHEVTFVVTTLTSNHTNLVALHYSEVSDKWEAITIDPAKVDYTKKTVTVAFSDLSPVAIYATTSTGGSQGQSPTTAAGTSSAWMLWMAAAVVVIGAGVVVYQKKRQ